MRSSESNLKDNDASYYINKLFEFIGSFEVEKALQKHKRTLDLSGPIVSKTILRNRHPWWNAVSKVLDMKKKGMSIKRRLTPEIKMLVADGLRITKLKRFMPDSVQRKYKRDLVDTHRAFDYLFEIQIAWHYYIKGHELQWYEDDGEKHPEFLVKTPSFDFNVECKRISVDMKRKITRERFSRFVEKLFSGIDKINYSGNIDIVLNDRLESNYIDQLTEDIVGLVNSGKTKQIYQKPYGEVRLSLTTKIGKEINFEEVYKQSSDAEPRGKHIAYISLQKNGDNVVDPIIVSIVSKKPDKLLEGIYEKLYDAASSQLNDSTPGIIVAFLEDICDLRDLGSGTGLQLMTNKLLSKERLSHIAGISYCSETQIIRHITSEEFSSQNLFFRNPNCKFEDVKNYQFINT